ncbi:MAG: hypothetical protein ACLFST_09815, partial [Spirochaetia bacterium]
MKGGNISKKKNNRKGNGPFVFQIHYRQHLTINHLPLKIKNIMLNSANPGQLLLWLRKGHNFI